MLASALGETVAAIAIIIAAIFEMQDVVEMLVLHGAEAMDKEQLTDALFMASVFGWASRPECVVWMDKLVNAGAELRDMVSRMS